MTTKLDIAKQIAQKTGIKRKLFGFLLWETAHSDIYFANKLFPDFASTDFLKAVQSWKNDEEIKDYSE